MISQQRSYAKLIRTRPSKYLKAHLRLKLRLSGLGIISKKLKPIIAAVVKSARDTRLSDVRIQRANLPSEVAKQYAQPA